MNRIDLDTLRHLDARYPEPHPYDTAESLARFRHEDLPSLSPRELAAERILALDRWACFVHARVPPSAWLEERIARLEQSADQTNE